MTAVYLARFGIILLHILYACCRDDPPNVCPEVTGCRCHETWTPTAKKIYGNKIIAECKHATDPPLQLLRRANLAKVYLFENTFTNISQLKRLRTTNAFRFTFIRNNFPNEEKPLFNWDWLPKTASNLSLTENGFYGFHTGDLSNNCNATRFGDHLYLLAKDEKFGGIPNCLPDRIDKMTLINQAEYITQEEFKWPSHLSVLRLSGGGVGKFSSQLFKNAPSSMKTLWITEQKLGNSSWLADLPADSLEKLFITHAELQEIPEAALERFRRVNTLEQVWLSYNNLTDIPRNLPGSVKSLRLDNNKITHITAGHWSTLKNLTLLDLTKNNLLTVPLEMPESLTLLYLSDNNIYSSPPDAFRHLKHLEKLDLSSNKLTKLPEDVQPGLRFYMIHTNQISVVNNPKEYDFCVNCTSVMLFGNPWHCNLKMLKMLNWFVIHHVRVVDEGQEEDKKDQLSYCNQVGFKGVDSSWLPTAMEFMDYFRQPPNNKCTYEIETLECIDANLVQLPERIPPGLIHISITDNPQFTSVPDYKFYNQIALTKLQLDNNSLSHIPVGLPSSLTFLSLDNNNLGSWTDEDLVAFKNLTSLRYLHLADNNIPVLYAWQFEGLKDLVWIGLAGNKLHCDCSLQSFSYYFTQIAPITKTMVARQYPVCKTPPDRENIDIRRLTGYYSYGINCIPRKCGYDFFLYRNESRSILNCSKAFQADESKSYLYGFVPGEEIHVPTSTFWVEIDLSGLELQSSQINYKNLSRMEIVDLSWNLQTEIPLEGLPASVKSLNLSHNEISVLPAHKTIFQHLPKIRVLDLSFNQISIVTSQVSNFEVIPKLLLYGNPLICNCTSEPLVEWVQLNLNSTFLTKRHQLQKLTCRIQGESQTRRISDVDYTEYCPSQPLAVLLGIIAAVVVILLLTLVLGNVYYHRKRTEKVNAEILLGFQGLLENETSEEDPETGMTKEYKFDAFISYDPNGLDAEFVISLLEEMEDKQGYRLCLSERDFIPGAGVTDNIVECIGASKHVVLVLSRSFIASPWCQCEVQAALAELHQRRRSQLLISVLLEDISIDEDTVRSVKTLLSFAPGLTAPQYMPDEGKEWREFWNKLTALMPHPISEMEV